MSHPVPDNEDERLDALHALNILDTEPEEHFDRLTDLAATVCDTPTALITLIDEDRQWFKSCFGFDTRETDLDSSFCVYVVHQEEMIVVEDVTEDPRFEDNPLVTGPPHIRFYAGALLTSPDGVDLGTLCVIDYEPRTFGAEKQALLSELAGVASDLLTARQQSLKVSYLTSALEQADEPVLITDGTPLDPPGPKIRWMNDAFERMTGYDEDELLGETPRLLQGPETGRETLDRVRQALEAGESTRAQTVNYRKDETPYVAQWTAAPVHSEDGTVSHWVSVQRDVTDQQQREERLRHEAQHDDLTGLLRRDALEERMDTALEGESAPGGLLYIDLDRFKQVNDSLGHSAGDELLRRVSDILRKEVRSTDVVARIGGDEFVVWLASAEDEEEAASVAERIGEALEQPFAIQGEEVFVGASVGVLPDLSTYDAAEVALHDADAAMYRAKEHPGHSFVVHNSSMTTDSQERLRLDTALHRAVEMEQFEPYFHPIVRLADGAIHGCEILARWRTEDGEIISPGRFLEVAEETGLIGPIGHQVIRKACRVCRTLHEPHGNDFKLALSGNFSRSEFFRPETRDFVADVLREHDIEPSQFTMEITERSVSASDATNRETIQALKDLGVRIEIDDFGTGHSSLHSLLQFPANGVKFDKAITAQLDASERGNALVQSMLEMADRLSLTATAEGIENEHQLERLRAFDCPYGQGYLFTPPVSSHALRDLVESPPWASYWSDADPEA